MNLSQRGQMFEWTPTPQIRTVLLQLFYRAFLTIPATILVSYLYMFWSLSTNTEIYSVFFLFVL